ncbi:DUF983 domain-containing protein [Flexibacter flexilis]|nr:DUF983 domain-containing protein [Flexibacter flexilis]
MQTRPKLQALVEGRCPRCGEDKLFSHSALSLKNFDKMHTNCSNCGMRYEIEPGFFIGAMYVSYAITVGMMLVTGFLLYHLAGNPEAWVYITTVVGLFIMTLPLIFRTARIIYIYSFSGVDYEPEKYLKKAS